MATIRERPGRPRGDGNNRERILDAAREEFADRGYRGATLRSIATRAGVDVALLSHYFTNKDGLFAATMTLPDEAPSMLRAALSGDPATQGERLTRAYLDLWEDAGTGPQLRMLVRSALSNEAAADGMHRLLTGAIAGPQIAPLIAGRETGFALAMSHLLGIATTRHLLGIPYVAQLDLDDLVALVAPGIQRHLVETTG